MRVFLNANKLPNFKRSVVTIGSYDGVHLGHQAILRKVVELANDMNGESTLITFYPHPRIFLQGKNADIKLLNTRREKIQLLEKIGLDNIVIVPFDKSFSEQSAQTYLEDFLVKKFNPEVLIVGYDHRFGKDRDGNYQFLQANSKKYGFELIQIEKQTLQELAISSTKIRKALAAGQIKLVSKLLGYPYILSGIVVHGKQIGRDIGYPTANIELEESEKLIPPEGVYAVSVKVHKKLHKGMMYIGRRPTLNDNQNRSIEVNIFDFSEDIYNEYIEVHIQSYLRGDQKFKSLDVLKKQLKLDEINAHKALKMIRFGDD